LEFRVLDSLVRRQATYAIIRRMAHRPKRPRDPNELAFMMVQLATGQRTDPEPPKKNAAAVELGRLGGLKGGKARKLKVPKEVRSELARKAVKARWKKQRESPL